MVGRFGLVNPGHHSKVSPSCLVFGDIHNYFISGAKNDLPPFLLGVLQGGVLCDNPQETCWCDCNLFVHLSFLVKVDLLNANES